MSANIKANSKRYYIKHRERLLAYSKEWRKEHPIYGLMASRRYEKTPKGQLARQRSRKKHIKDRSLWLTNVKNRPCMDCQGWFSPWQMDFDHRDPKEKHFNIGSSRLLGFKRLLAEVSKCDIVCSNCHRNRTQKRRFPNSWMSSVITGNQI